MKYFIFSYCHSLASFPKLFWLLLAQKEGSVTFPCLPEFCESWSMNSSKHEPSRLGSAASPGWELKACYKNVSLWGFHLPKFKQNLIVALFGIFGYICRNIQSCRTSNLICEKWNSQTGLGLGGPWCCLEARGQGKQLLGRLRICTGTDRSCHRCCSELGPVFPCPASIPSSSKADFRLLQQDQLLCTSCFWVSAEHRCLCLSLGLAVIAVKTELKEFGVVEFYPLKIFL